MEFARIPVYVRSHPDTKHRDLPLPFAPTDYVRFGLIAKVSAVDAEDRLGSTFPVSLTIGCVRLGERCGRYGYKA